jgi:hypothetical protein
MVASLTPPPKLQFFDSNGDPLVGGKLYSYAAGTTTPQATYVDYAGVSTNTNPVILDSRGEANVWLKTNPYKLVLKSSTDVEIWTVDNIYPQLTQADLNIFASSSGSSLVGYIQGGTNSVATTVQSKLREVVSVFDFMTAAQIASVRARNGVEDVTSAIQNAINYFTTGQGTVFFPGGLYKVTSTITIAQNRVHLVGQGIYATQISFAPTANGSCFSFTAGASSLYQCSLRNMNFRSGDNTYVKTAISLNDIREFELVDVEVGGSVVAVPGSTFWSDATNSSRGLYTTGREALSVQRFKAYADKPIVLGPNTNFASIDTDHFHFQDCFLAAANNPCVTALDGVQLSNVTFDGYQTWNLGTHGFYWLATTAAAASHNLSFNNVRSEQGLSSTAYMFYINDSTNGIYNVSINNCRMDSARNGIYARAVIDLSINNSVYAGTAGTTALNVSATVNGININNFYAVGGSSATLTGQYLVSGNPSFDGTSPLPTNAIYANTQSLAQIETTAAVKGYRLAVANNATGTVRGANLVAGFLTLVDDRAICGRVALYGSNGVSELDFSAGGQYSVTINTAGQTNIYWDAGTSTYVVQNKTGADRVYYLTLTGTYSAIT